MITFIKSENILLDLKKKYYFYYIKFNKSGFSRKITPKPCYLKDAVGQKDCFLVFEDEERTKLIGYYYTFTNSYPLLEYSGIFETFEDCVKSFNSVIDTRVEQITDSYNNYLDKLVKSIIKI